MSNFDDDDDVMLFDLKVNIVEKYINICVYAYCFTSGTVSHLKVNIVEAWEYNVVLERVYVC
jgi:hypothetical protein